MNEIFLSSKFERYRRKNSRIYLSHMLVHTYILYIYTYIFRTYVFFAGILISGNLRIHAKILFYFLEYPYINLYNRFDIGVTYRYLEVDVHIKKCSKKCIFVWLLARSENSTSLGIAEDSGVTCTAS